jgi:hypothetical protein
MRHLALPLALSCAVALVACGVTKRRQLPGNEATVGGGATVAGYGGEAQTSAGADTAGSPSDSSSLAAPPGASEALQDESAGPYDLRRLTQREYRQTLSDLLPGMAGIVLEASAAFPLDEVGAHGYRSPSSFSAAHVQSLLDAAEALADAAFTGGAIPVPCTETSDVLVLEECAGDFIRSFGRRAFRRPPTSDEEKDLALVFSTALELGFDFRESIAQLVSAMLQSPNFLYHWEQGDDAPVAEGALVALTPHQLASRLSYLLRESMPDEPLLAAADAGQLATVEQLAQHAERLLAEPGRSGVGLSTFHRQWLGVEDVGALEKDPARFPTFTPLVAEALDGELPAFVSAVFSTADSATLQALLSAPYAYANRASAPLYGTAVASPAFERIELDATQRAGLLTQAAFLAMHASDRMTDPGSRGAAVFERLLCGESGSPADALGLAFENYDALGVYRTTDDGQLVDASGETVTPLGATLRFDNAVHLMQQLAKADEVKWCATRQWFRYGLGRMESAADLGSLQRAYLSGAESPAFALRSMLVTFVQSKTFRYRALASD